LLQTTCTTPHVWYRLPVDVGQRDAHALGREPLGHRAADAARTARDDCDAMSEIPHWRSVRPLSAASVDRGLTAPGPVVG
jgi:hypothetical protein